MAGSEKRQRGELLQIRLSNEELTAICEAADRAGLPAASHAREVLLAAKTIRSVRRPPIDRSAVAQLLAMLGQTATELRTLARPSNTKVNEDDLEKLADCILQISEMRDALMNALRRQP
jgi:imidazolonepropionase-like amidohydrolase